MKSPGQIWSNPYKTRLWMSDYNGGTFCKKELELWNHLAGYCTRGCKDTNAQLCPVIDRGRTTVKKYLSNLKRHYLIDIVPGWAELAGNKFVKSLRYRRITALPWPSKRSWMKASVQNMLKRVGRKSDHFQRRTTKSSIKRSRDELLYGRIPDALNADTGKTPVGILPGGQIPPDPPGGSKGSEEALTRLRKNLIDRLIKVGHARARAINLADIAFEHELKKRLNQVEAKKIS